MLALTLNTNEVKDRSAAEVEFQSLDKQARSHEYALITEAPSLPHRLKISHLESGKGTKRRRRSVIRVDKTTISPVDSVTPIVHSAYVVLDLPVGGMSTTDEAKNVLAELTSFISTLGGTATLLYDGSGTGAAALITGGL